MLNPFPFRLPVRNRLLTAAMLLGGALLPVAVAAQDNLTNLPDPDPAAELAALRVADGFEVNLFAAEPMIDPPVQMSWDAQGRLWVATSTSYPQPVPGQAPNDKIFVLEDTDGDGRADRSTLFADGLLTPTGIAPALDGGVYVAHATEVIHLRDRDGDGRADAREVVLSGFGTDDTHHLIHTFRWGPDGQFYLIQSVYIYSHIETPWGVQRLEGGGIWQYDPDTQRLGVMARGMWNAWGFDFDAWGQSFATDGAGFQGIQFVFPGAAYAPTGGGRVLEGLNPGHPKYAGLVLLSGRHFPDTLAGQLVTSDYRANRVKRFVLRPAGSGFTAEEQPDLIWTDHIAFRPVDVNQGPDGALYLADWYNPIIQHGEVDFRDPRRDHRRGRIWRVTAKGRPTVAPTVLTDATPIDTLLAALTVPEVPTRRHARRLLKRRGAAAVRPALDRWAAALPPGAPSTPQHRLEALWTYQALGLEAPALLTALLQADDARARAAAVRVLTHQIDRRPDGARSADALRNLTAAARDPDAQVRREAVTALGRTGRAEAAPAALAVLDQPMDRFLDYALWHTVQALEPAWLPALLADDAFFGGHQRQEIFALRSAQAPAALDRLAAHYERGWIPDDEAAAVLDVLAQQGGPAAVQHLFEMALRAQRVGENDLAAHLDALVSAAQGRSLTPETGAARVLTLFDTAPADLHGRVALLVGHWHVETGRPHLLAMADDDQATPAVRRDALRALVALDEEKAWALLAARATPETPLPLRRWAAEFLPGLDAVAAAPVAADVLATLPDAAEAAPLYQAFIRQEGGLDALTAALQQRPPPAVHAQAGLDLLQNRGDDADPLRAVLIAAGAEPLVPRMTLNPGFYARQRLEHDAKAAGNAARGEAVFRQPSLLCLHCHALGGAGGSVGPDLAGVGASAPMDYLITALLEPERAIKDGYEMLRVVQTDGGLVDGILAQETASALVLYDAAGTAVTVPKAQVARREVVPGSLMPAGLMAQLDRDAFIDLVAFLSALGDDEAYRIDATPRVRRWQVLEDSEAVRAAYRAAGAAFAQAAPAAAWQPRYSTVAGRLPLAEVPMIDGDGQAVQVMRFEVTVAQSGTVAFQLDERDGVSLWVGTERLADTQPLALHLSAGQHPVTLVIDPAAYDRDAVAVGLDAAGTTAQVSFVLGR